MEENKTQYQQNQPNQNFQETPTQTVIIQTQTSETNGLWIAGFVLSLIAIFTSWIPIIWRIIWLLWLVLSAIWILKQPRWFAIAGLIISVIIMLWWLILFLWIISLATHTG